MSFDKSAFANEMLDKALWWRYAIDDDNQIIELSDSLQLLFEGPIRKLNDLTGQYTTPLMSIKIQQILENPAVSIRFSASFDTLMGKLSFQHCLSTFESEGVRYIWAVCIEITEMIELEREMVDAQGRLSLNQVYERETLLLEQNKFINDSYKKQSRFLAMLSHELRSPLLGISSLVERLQKQLGAESVRGEVVTALKTIHMTAEQSIFLVNDILTYSQTEYDVITLHPMTFSLKGVLENVKQLTKSIASDKNLIVSMIYLGQRDLVVGDSVRLSQILINLIVNSLKFTQFGGVSIEVTEKADNHFRFKITDSGEGISAEQQAHIFEPFEQLESRGSSLNIGSGLGLFVVKKLVLLMGGEISVKSNVGISTSFYVDLALPRAPKVEGEKAYSNLPVVVVKNAKEPESKKASILKSHESQQTAYEVKAGNDLSQNRNKAHTSNHSRKHYKILVADDSKINRMILAGYLEEQNCSVSEAMDGKQAWDIFQKENFDFVFLDIQMPFLDGIEVSQKIQQSIKQNPSHAKKLKGVFAITAGGEESNLIPQGESLASVGFNGWFVKPVTKAQIIGLLQETQLSSTSETPAQPLEQITHAETNQVEAENEWDGVDKIPVQFHALIDSFLIEMRDGLAEMDVLNKAHDEFALAAKAHYFKGNCMLFQLDKMVSLFKTVEGTIQYEDQPHIKQQKVDLVLEKLEISLKYLEKSLAIRHNGFK
ncbi:ATP-binding response regulator [Thiomicrorhabdus arctica]|uniref:ATP-binding response regulator n=1 Tax=Thiomicrorhabdus arctica TaxID=131540 RepID=UPI00036AF5A0|nr:ATP-binding protein [Thiomicrorhabdus arctica]